MIVFQQSTIIPVSLETIASKQKGLEKTTKQTVNLFQSSTYAYVLFLRGQRIKTEKIRWMCFIGKEHLNVNENCL